MLVGGMFSAVCLKSCSNRALSALRGKLNEINARYQGSGVDFDLHISSHLELYTRSSNNDYGGRRTGVRTVMDYTLVVQNIQQVGDMRIPSSNALANQALSGFGGGMQQPMQQGMQQPMVQQPVMQQPMMQQPMQQPLIMAQPMGGAQPGAYPMPAPQMMSVTCPAGAMPGTSVQIQAPDGRVLAVQIPAGVVPGAQFQVQL